ncbi:unnamed protein product [Amoebophrya sp. A120]|nr:unnamed protein product [Amoebophrya sp. A120]|eukprot:GSA120T00000504001.1
MGVLSRGENGGSGIAVVDDSDMPVYKDKQNWNQHEKAPGLATSNAVYFNGDYNPDQFTLEGNKDYYFFAFGSERNAYKKSLLAFRELSGPQPLVPRYNFGYWLSYWQWATMRTVGNEGGLPFKAPWSIPFTLEMFDQVLKNMFQALGMPIDVYVLDMQWININGGADLAGPRDRLGSDLGLKTNPYWGAYKPDPEMGDLETWHNRWTDNDTGGLQISYNVHPHVGALRDLWMDETKYEKIVTEIGCDRSIGGCFWGHHAENTKFVNMLDDVAMPIQKSWIPWWDWQSGDYIRISANANNNECRQVGDKWPCGEYETKNWFPLHSIARVTYDGPARRQEDRRGLQMTRFSGYGAQRYPLGFVGDQDKNWEALAFSPYWTVTASNAAYGYWTHDLICCDWSDPDRYQSWEKYLRWFQFGALTGNMRTHDKGSGAKRQDGDMGAHMLLWDWPFPVMNAAKQLLIWRTMLIPYLYTTAYIATYTNVSPMRPIYYDWPEFEQSYTEVDRDDFEEVVPFSYMLGHGLLTNPVVKSNGANPSADYDVPREAGYSHDRVKRAQFWVYNVNQWPFWLPPARDLSIVGRTSEGMGSTSVEEQASLDVQEGNASGGAEAATAGSRRLLLPPGDEQLRKSGPVFWYDLMQGRTMFSKSNSAASTGDQLTNKNMYLIDEFPLFQLSSVVIPLNIRKFIIGGATREKYMQGLIWQVVAPGARFFTPPANSDNDRASSPIVQRGLVKDDAYGLTPDYVNGKNLEISCVVLWQSRTEVYVFLKEDRSADLMMLNADDKTSNSLVSQDDRRFSLFLHNFAGTVVDASFAKNPDAIAGVDFPNGVADAFAALDRSTTSSTSADAASSRTTTQPILLDELQPTFLRPKDEDTPSSSNVDGDVQTLGLRTVTACVLSCTRIQNIRLGVTKLVLEEKIAEPLLQGLRGADRKVGRARGKREVINAEPGGGINIPEWKDGKITSLERTVRDFWDDAKSAMGRVDKDQDYVTYALFETATQLNTEELL